MFYEESQIKNLLKCHKCNKICDESEDPRLLPCQKVVCNKCIIEIEEQALNFIFKCELCSKEHSISKEGFPVNEMLITLLRMKPYSKYRGKEYEIIKKNLNDLKKLIGEIKFNSEHGKDTIKEHCLEQKRLIQLATEERIQELNKLNEGFIEEVNRYEKECIETCTANLDFEKLVEETYEFIDDKESFINKSQFDSDELKTLYSQTQNLKRKLNQESRKMKSLTFNHQLILFDSNKKLRSELLLGEINYRIFRCNKLISACCEKIHIRDLNTGEHIKTFSLKNDNFYIKCLVIISNNILISGCTGGLLKLWNIETGECFKVLNVQLKCILSILVLSTDKIIICTDDKIKLQLYDLKYDFLLRFEAHTGEECCIDKISDDQIVTCDKQIKIWNINTGDCLKTLKGHSNTICCLKVLFNERLVSGSSDDTIKLWDLNTGDCLKTLIGHSDTVRCIEQLSEEEIISGSEDRTIKIWDLSTGDCLKTFGDYEYRIFSINIISSDTIVSSANYEKVKVWDLNRRMFENYNY